MAYSKYNLSINSQKLIMILASNVQPNDNKFKETEFSVTELAEILEVSKENIYKELPKITAELVSKLILFKYNDELGNECFMQGTFLSTAEYKKNLGKVLLEFSPKIAPYLLELKKYFSKYKLYNPLSFSSKYSLRFYQLFKTNEIKREFCIELKTIRDILDLKQKSYEKYNRLKEKVINISVEEVNKFTDILVEFEEIKTGRKVTSLKFYIKENVKNKKDNNFIEIENKKEEIKDKKEKNIVENEEEKEIKIDEFEDKNIKYLYELFEEKISKKNIEKILVNAENDIEKVERIYNYSKKQNIENLIGFMIKMVKGDNFIEPVEDKKELVFNDFPQRNYDYDKLENQLLGYHQDIEDYNQDENIQIKDNSKNNDNELEINDIEHEEEKEEIIYRSEIDTVKMFLEEQLKGIFGEVKYKTWLKYGVDNLDIDDKNIVHFCCTNSFALNMFERDYKDVLLELISSIEPKLKLNPVIK